MIRQPAEKMLGSPPVRMLALLPERASLAASWKRA
jgi:hypothetical protein